MKERKDRYVPMYDILHISIYMVLDKDMCSIDIENEKRGWIERVDGIR